MVKMHYNKQEFYRAHLARDIRFDGKFFVAVKTTKIYCRPICPARKAKLENLEFFIHAAQAEEAGYRPCLRCRPETAPGSAAWIGTSATVQRAIRLMDNLGSEDLSIKHLAKRLGIGERWLRELFQTQVGASPQTLLLAKKLDIARNLLDHSALSITDIAFSSGFESVRRFNDAFKIRFKKPPSDFRKNPLAPGVQSLQLRYRPPYAWKKILDFFAERAIPGMELVEDNTYQRLLNYGDTEGWMKVSLSDAHKINISFKFNKPTNILDFVSRIKDMFDLDADPMAIEKDLRKDNKLKPWLKKYKGLRIPGCWDSFELAVRAIIGQKISVKAARTVLTRLVNHCGEKQTLDASLPLERFFPTPKNILLADLSKIGLTTTKIQTLKALAQAIENKKIIINRTSDHAEIYQQLLSIKGIGQWTVDYIAMRVLRDPDAFPATDLVIKNKIKQFDLDSKKWAPWRAYAATLLFTLPAEKKS